MAIPTIRNIPHGTDSSPTARAQSGRSAGSEVRDILSGVVEPKRRVRMGNALRSLGRKVGLGEADFALLDQKRDQGPPMAPHEACQVRVINPWDKRKD